jgi:hypothetical protein
MQHGQVADLCAEMSGIGGDALQGAPNRPEENIVDHALILKRNRGNGGRNRKNDVEVFDRQEFGLAFLQPTGSCERLALGTVAVATRVICDMAVPALIAFLHVASQSSGTALNNRAQYRPLLLG